MKLLVILLSLSLSSCAYKVGLAERTLPEGYKTIFVEQFSNATQSVGAEAYFTSAMIRELKRSGFAFVASRDKAELILSGRIMLLDYVGTATANEFPNFQGGTFASSLFTRYLLSAVAVVKVRKTVDKSVVWQSTIRGSKNFLSPKLTQPGVRTSNPLYNQSIRDENVRLVANDMMNEAFDQLTENF